MVKIFSSSFLLVSVNLPSKHQGAWKYAGRSSWEEMQLLSPVQVSNNPSASTPGMNSENRYIHIVFLDYVHTYFLVVVV